MISCHSEHRQAYGWQRHGGHAPYLLAEENTCVRLPDNLSYVDGALIACGFETAWEALTRIGVNGQDRLLVTGLGPVGLAAAMLGRALGAHGGVGRTALALGPSPREDRDSPFHAATGARGLPGNGRRPVREDSPCVSGVSLTDLALLSLK
jgi:hypothetical protein